MAQPSADAVTQFCEFSGLGPGGEQVAIVFLKGNNNNFEQAVVNYFDNPDPSRYEKQLNYDESQFSSDRHGVPQSGQVPAFQIEGEDAGVYPQFGPLGAPTRPSSPSRQGQNQAQTYGPHLPPPEYGTTQGNFDTSKSKEESDFDEAVKRSMADAQTGVINASGHEVVPDVDAVDRRRIEGEPVSLKHMLRPDFLPALINILHTVPPLHDYLLSTDAVLDDYGYNSHWWSGESIEAPTVSYYDDSVMTNASDASFPPIVAEVQRLMAFLDKTERSYGSAEPLSRVHSISILEQTGAERKSLLFRFLEAWESRAGLQSAFRTTILDKDGTKTFVHGYPIPSGIPSAGKEPTLIELLDNIIWDKQPNGDFEAENFLEDVAPVLIFTIPPHSTWKLKAPTSFYLDRYLLSNKPVVAQMKEQNAKYVQQIEKIDEQLQKLRSFKFNPSTGMSLGPQKEGDALQLMEDSIKYLKERADIATDENVNVHEEVADMRTVKKLQAILRRIQERIQSLNEAKTGAQEAMQELSTVLTIPNSSEPDSSEPEHLFVFAGISTSSMRLLNTYVQYPFGQSDSQWWQLTYDTTHIKPRISKTLVSESEVITAAAQGIDDTMLVYVAASTLDSPPPISLPPRLKAFVEKDNAAFRDELAHAEQMASAPGPAVPVSITGVRTRSDSGGSNDSMKVQRDDIDEGIEMDDRAQPPPYDNGDAWDGKDVKMGSPTGEQPEMQEVGQGRPGLFGMRRGGSGGDYDRS